MSTALQLTLKMKRDALLNFAPVYGRLVTHDPALAGESVAGASNTPAETLCVAALQYAVAELEAARAPTWVLEILLQRIAVLLGTAPA